jgi:hypothetical protein
MLGKLLYGQLSLKETFWKFAVLGSFAAVLVMKIVKLFLLAQLKGLTIVQYYMHHFSPLQMNGTLIFLTMLYLLGAFILCSYSVIIALGVWRSSAEYDKSIWLGYMARLLTFIIIYFNLKLGL